MSAPFTDPCMTVLAPTKHVDLAIIGGGCAGLSLARELAGRQTSRSVVIIEPRTHYDDDRSWCFWAPRQHAQSHLVSHLWSNWLFGHQGQPNNKRGSSHNPYQYIRSSDFYQDSYDKIAQCPSIELQLGTSVQSVMRHENCWRIDTNNNHFLATNIIDTRPPGKDQFSKATLYQCFLGAELELNGQINVDPSVLELMTDMRVVNQDYCFTYLLPMSNHRLLIELTLFSTQPHTAESLQSAFNQLLDDRGYRNANILRTEYGILPMGLPEDKSELPRAGMGGGALRPSSGYGFMRIQRWAKQCAEYYCAHDDILAQPSSGFMLKKMDQLFLDVLRSQPQRVPALFDQLLGRTETERFIRFMNDRARSLDYLNIVMCLPKGPFIKALLSNIFARP